MVRFAGTLQVRGGGRGIGVEVRCAHGAVARRLRATLVEVLDLRPGLARRHGGNLTGSDGYLVEVDEPALRPLGILDGDRRPLEGIRSDLAGRRPAYLAGTFMVAGSLSGAGKPVHLEVGAPSERTAADLGLLMGGTVSAARVVVKGGDRVADLLADVGAIETFLAFDQGRMRRDLRGQVNRTVNADRANLRRTADTAAIQIEAIQHLVDRVGWDALQDDLREVALVRLVNPEASLGDLGRLLDPAVTKATVHRRLRRLERLAAEPDGTW